MERTKTQGEVRKANFARTAQAARELARTALDGVDEALDTNGGMQHARHLTMLHDFEVLVELATASGYRTAAEGQEALDAFTEWVETGTSHLILEPANSHTSPTFYL